MSPWDSEESAMDAAWGRLRSPETIRREEAEARNKANADGWYDAWRGWRADPFLLNDDYASDYMDGYREVRPVAGRAGGTDG